ncbi:hypothetical protein Tco_0919869 [Tanacetum coccineum]
MTSAEEIHNASLIDTKVKVVKGKHMKPHRGIKVFTPGSASADSVLRRLRSAKVTGKARDRVKDTPGDNRGRKRVVSTPMNDEINSSVMNDLDSSMAKSRGLKTSHDHTSMGDVGNIGVGIASSKDGIVMAEKGILNDREKAGLGNISKHTSMEDDLLVLLRIALRVALLVIRLEEFGKINTSNPFAKKSVVPNGGAWKSTGSNVLGSSMLSNQFSADVDRFAKKLKQDTEEMALKMEYVLSSVRKLENGNRRISFSVEDVYKGGQSYSLQLYGYFVGTSMDYRVVRGNLMTNSGIFYFTFKSEEGMRKVLESGP